ncbi:MAG: SDR family oxidoreductase [Novosphingobium sp.]|nr:SDR family oxidoreductase [Novosphingobium sp.]
MSEENRKPVWITGGSSGIGLAAALELASAGHPLALTGRREVALKSACAQVEAAGGNATYAVADVASASEVERAHREIVTRLGPVGVLINSAGFNIPERSWSTLRADGFDEAVAGNLNGSLYTILEVLPGMRAMEDGLIVNLISGAGRYVWPGAGPAYMAAKHAVFAMTSSLNMEEARNGIRACALCPGEVDTPIMDKRPQLPSDDQRSRMLSARDVGRFIRYLVEAPPTMNFTEVVIMPTGRVRKDD